MKLLIIDDEPLVRRSLKRAAEINKHEVFEAEDGKQGVAAWQKLDPDLVILDVLMPGLSGPQVLEVIGPDRRAKVILISAYTGDYNNKKLNELRVDLFISKPFSDIFKVIQQAEELIGV